jgi:8-oxo-dGTP pyrophosphatase MutT (NUDIX family)
VRGGDVVVIVPHKRGARGQRVLGLPKGHVEAGESTLQAAVREVREEAGVCGELQAPLGEISYTFERRGLRIGKRVEFFLFEYRSGDPADHDHEIAEARFMPMADALRELTYEQERTILRRAMSLRRPDR